MKLTHILFKTYMVRTNFAYIGMTLESEKFFFSVAYIVKGILYV